MLPCTLTPAKVSTGNVLRKQEVSVMLRELIASWNQSGLLSFLNKNDTGA